jgi:hypothetical protein
MNTTRGKRIPSWNIFLLRNDFAKWFHLSIMRSRMVYFMTSVCEGEDVSLSSCGFLQPVRQKRRDGGVEVFYAILDPLFTSHTLPYILPFSFFQIHASIRTWGILAVFQFWGGRKEISVMAPSTSNISPIKHHDHLKKRLGRRSGELHAMWTPHYTLRWSGEQNYLTICRNNLSTEMPTQGLSTAF